jgi:hypothetical protein
MRPVLGPAQRLLVLAGLALVVFGAAAGLWEVFALQAPFTPLRAPHLPGPIAQLRESGIVLGLLFFAAGSLLPLAIDPGARIARVLAWIAIGGAALVMAALAAGAARGMVVFQIFDPRPVAVRLFAVRAMGSILVGGAFLELARRLARALLVRDDARGAEQSAGQRGEADVQERVDPNETPGAVRDHAGARGASHLDLEAAVREHVNETAPRLALDACTKTVRSKDGAGIE